MDKLCCTCSPLPLPPLLPLLLAMSYRSLSDPTQKRYHNQKNPASLSTRNSISPPTYLPSGRLNIASHNSPNDVDSNSNSLSGSSSSIPVGYSNPYNYPPANPQYNPYALPGPSQPYPYQHPPNAPNAPPHMPQYLQGPPPPPPSQLPVPIPPAGQYPYPLSSNTSLIYPNQYPLPYTQQQQQQPLPHIPQQQYQSQQQALLPHLQYPTPLQHLQPHVQLKPHQPILTQLNPVPNQDKIDISPETPQSPSKNQFHSSTNKKSIKFNPAYKNTVFINNKLPSIPNEESNKKNSKSKNSKLPAHQFLNFNPDNYIPPNRMSYSDQHKTKSNQKNQSSSTQHQNQSQNLLTF
ncbi:uncharacterized protein ASCRUDRAFT_74942, partial [Ascoidea rubescens DSM 1968]